MKGLLYRVLFLVVHGQVVFKGSVLSARSTLSWTLRPVNPISKGRNFGITKRDWLTNYPVVWVEDEYRRLSGSGVVLRLYIKLKWHFLCQDLFYNSTQVLARISSHKTETMSSQKEDLVLCFFHIVISGQATLETHV